MVRVFGVVGRQSREKEWAWQIVEAALWTEGKGPKLTLIMGEEGGQIVQLVS